MCWGEGVGKCVVVWESYGWGSCSRGSWGWGSWNRESWGQESYGWGSQSRRCWEGWGRDTVVMVRGVGVGGVGVGKVRRIGVRGS